MHIHITYTYNIYMYAQHKQVYVVHVLNLILASYTLALSFAFLLFCNFVI